MPRFFTVEEAEGLLPEIRPLLEEVQELRGRIEGLRRELAEIAPPSRSNGHTAQAPQFLLTSQHMRALWDQMSAALQRLHALDVELKDVERGLIDFPSLRGGREVYLCWRLGESQVEYWHEKDAGFRSRQRL